MRKAWRAWVEATGDLLGALLEALVFGVLGLLGEEQEPGTGDVAEWLRKAGDQ